MSSFEDRADDATPIALSTLAVKDTFKHESKDWLLLDSIDAYNNPQCACLSTGELRAITPATLVVKTSMFFDEK